MLGDREVLFEGAGDFDSEGDTVLDAENDVDGEGVRVTLGERDPVLVADSDGVELGVGEGESDCE